MFMVYMATFLGGRGLPVHLKNICLCVCLSLMHSHSFEARKLKLCTQMYLYTGTGIDYVALGDIDSCNRRPFCLGYICTYVVVFNILDDSNATWQHYQQTLLAT